MIWFISLYDRIKKRLAFYLILTFFLFGGSDEIRTHGAFPHGGFQDRRNKPTLPHFHCLAHGLGFEPRRAVLETAMLPITSSMYLYIIALFYQITQINLALRAGLEPSIPALKGRCPNL